MKDLLALLAINLTEYWILILLMQYLCAASIKINRRNVIIGSGISLLVTALAVWHNGEYSLLFSMLIAIAITILLFSSRRFTDLLRFFPAMAIYFSVTIAPESLLQEILTSRQVNFNANEDTWFFFARVTDGVLLIALIVLAYVLTKYKVVVHFSVKEILGSIALLFFTFIDIGLVVFLNSANLGTTAYFIYLAIFILGFLSGVGYYLYSLIESRVRVYRQAVARSEREYLQVQLDSLQEVKENEENVRKMRHDLNKHLAVINSLCEEGNYDEVKKYTSQLSHNVLRTDSKLVTGNAVADLIVSSKKKTCEKNNIEFTFTGSLEKLDALEAPDICGLLANAYDNAIEACLPQEKAYIHTAVNTTNNYTVIRITNSIDKKVTIRNNSISTTKKDKKSHGYGIKIMKQIVEKYRGNCTFSCNETEFTIKIVLLT